MTVIGIDAPSVERAANLLTPVGRAKLSMRIHPEESPGTAYLALRKHLEDNAPWGCQVSVTLDDDGSGFAADAQGPVYDAARAAFRDAWDGVEPVDIGVGGSIPFVAAFAERFPDAAILVTGVEDPDTARTRRTRACTWASSSASAWPRPSCWSGCPRSRRRAYERGTGHEGRRLRQRGGRVRAQDRYIPERITATAATASRWSPAATGWWSRGPARGRTAPSSPAS